MRQKSFLEFQIAAHEAETTPVRTCDAGVKITDIYATSVDYDPTDETSITFFKTVQNKMHWAIAGMTAAEIVRKSADADQSNMGLTSWRGEKVRKGDVTIAKNYLNEEELRALNNLVEQYLVFAEGQAIA